MCEPGFSIRDADPPAFVEQVLDQAHRLGASDVYWLPDPDTWTLRIRVSGAQREVARLPAAFGATCVARLKVLAGLLTYRKLIAQDGAIHRTAQPEIRVSVMPTNHGERVALRFLPAADRQPALDALGFPAPIVHLLRSLLEAPVGMIVLTGPTGSGKTTTIYALLLELLRLRDDPAGIVTLEDPIEQLLPGISQTSVAHDQAWDYAAALRAVLRQDVKTVVIGEMRDPDIVRLTLDAALTGHRVITTYHAGDIPSVYARMLHQGFEPFLVAAAVTGVVTQRLVPRTDGTGCFPVVAALRPDDAWRDTVLGNPGLEALRQAIRRYPDADLHEAARRLAQDDHLPEADRHRLRTGSPF